MSVVSRRRPIASEIIRRPSSRWWIAPPRMLRVSTVAMRIAIAVSRVLTTVRSARKWTGRRRAAGRKAARRCRRKRASVRPRASVHGDSVWVKEVSDPVASVYLSNAFYFCTQNIINSNYYWNSITTNINTRNQTVLKLLPAPPFG